MDSETLQLLSDQVGGLGIASQVFWIAVVVAIGWMILVSIIRSFLYIAKPNEVLIVSGRSNKSEHGGSRGYRLAKNTFILKLPIIETVDRMDLRTFPVHIEITGAYSHGGISLSVNAIANVKVSSQEPYVHNAIERFLGRGQEEIVRVARETLEGNLRSVLAKMTPEDVNENRMLFAEQLREDANPDLDKLGLHLDTLKIQNVSDSRGYLDSLGRRRIAEIIKVAEIAESDAKKEAAEAESRAYERIEVSKRQADTEIQRAKNNLRAYIAELEQEAKSEEERAEAKALQARAAAEKELQEVRTQLEELRLQADVVIPAYADKIAKELIAAGEAAAIAEDGRAMATVLEMMTQVWNEAGDAAMDVFLIQKLESVMQQVVEATKRVKVQEVALIDHGDGETLPNYVASYPRIVSSIFTELKNTVGLDITGALTGTSVSSQSPMYSNVPKVAPKPSISTTSSPKLAALHAPTTSSSTHSSPHQPLPTPTPHTSHSLTTPFEPEISPQHVKKEDVFVASDSHLHQKSRYEDLFDGLTSESEVEDPKQ